MAGNAFFVAAEFGLVAVDRATLTNRVAEGSAAARRTQKLVSNLSYHLSGAQFGITVTSILLGFVAEPTVAAVVEPAFESIAGESSRGVAIVVALMLATVFQMVLGELVPKTIAISKPYPTAAGLSIPVTVWGIVARPIVAVLNATANAIVRLLGVEPRDDLDETPSLAELGILIESAAEEGTIDRAEAVLLARSMRFGAKEAADVLVPRVEVVALSIEQTVDDLVARSLATGHSRFPIYESDLDNIVGVVHVKSVYRLPPAERAWTPVTALMDEPYVVPESRELDELFHDLRGRGTHLAVVIDEHGGTAGIVTLEDLLEEIVGEIDDEYDRVAQLTRAEEEGSYIVSGRLHPDELAEATGLQVPDGEYETLAGFVLHRLGHIPDPGEIVHHDGWRLEVVAMDRRRIASVRVVRPSVGPAPGAAVGSRERP